MSNPKITTNRNLHLPHNLPFMSGRFHQTLLCHQLSEKVLLFIIMSVAIDCIALNCWGKQKRKTAVWGIN